MSAWSGIWRKHQEEYDPQNAEGRAKFLASNLNRINEKLAARRLRLAAAESAPQSHTQSAPLRLTVLAEASNMAHDLAAREMLGPIVFNQGWPRVLDLVH